MLFKTLEETDTETLRQTFLLAFSDYSIPVDMPPERFAAFLKGNGFAPEMSIGAFDGDMLCGFIFNGVRQWQGVRTAYDGGTGVIPDYRKQGITTRMFGTAVDILRSHGVRQYLLEVIRTNTPAYTLYLKEGFRISRELYCYRAEKDKVRTAPSQDVQFIGIDADGETFAAMRDCHPSWQNSADSIAAVRDETVTAAVRMCGKYAGYGTIHKKSGNVYQLAVDKPHRGKGCGASLLAALCGKTEAGRISFINVDKSCESMRGFLEATGFELEVEQYEMIKAL